MDGGGDWRYVLMATAFAQQHRGDSFSQNLIETHGGVRGCHHSGVNLWEQSNSTNSSCRHELYLIPIET